MKGKIVVGLILGAIGAIYAFLIYPLLENTEDVSLSPINDVIPATEPGSIDSGSSPEGQRQNIQVDEPTANSQQLKANTICFNTHCFTIEIANTFASRQQGLMNREYLAPDAGMLFVFDTPGTYGFWMKNTLIPLDIVWLDESLIVVDTTTMQPCLADPCPNYMHEGMALYALEINAGLIEKSNITKGSSAIFTQRE